MILVEFYILRCIKYFLQVRINVLHYNEDVAHLFYVGGGYDIYQLCSENVVLHRRKLSKDLYLAEHLFALVLIAEGVK